MMSAIHSIVIVILWMVLIIKIILHVFILVMTRCYMTFNSFAGRLHLLLVVVSIRNFASLMLALLSVC